MFKRIILFLIVNLAFVLMITTVSNILGINQIYNNQPGPFGLYLNFTNLALYSMLIGFSGAFISLAISRWMAKRIYRIQVIDPSTTNPGYLRVVKKVHELASLAQLKSYPEVGVYDSLEPNAFATGPSRRRSLVAVSTGLLNNLTEDEVDGVLAHEIAHVANGDMVTMTLLQGVVNTFVVFLAKVLATVIASRGRSDSSGPASSFWLEIVFQIVLGILGSMIVMKFSRYREFRADHGGASLAGTPKMLAALKKLHLIKEQIMAGAARSSWSGLQNHEDTALANMKIAKMTSNSFLGQLFSSHPPLEERIRRLEAQKLIIHES